MRQIKVLVVDDSAVMRQLIAKMLGRSHDIDVIGTAFDGQDALVKAATLKPDVISLDVEMPRMDGLAALRRIMKENPVRVIMCSTLTSSGSKCTVEALEAGAFDFITKPSSPAQLEPMVSELLKKIRLAFSIPVNRLVRQSNIVKPFSSLVTGNKHFGATPGVVSGAIASKRTAPGLPQTRSATATRRGCIRLVVIGCSTGGPAALMKVVPALPHDLSVPVVIVQHIPQGFSRPLAEHLDRKSSLKVFHAEAGTPLKAGSVLVAPAGYDLTFQNKAGIVSVVLDLGSGPVPPGGFRPSVDGVMTAAAEVYGDGVLGVLMTGMGRDGAKGMNEIKRRSGRTIAEDESTCVIFSMPRAAIENGSADFVLPLPQIPGGIIEMVR